MSFPEHWWSCNVCGKSNRGLLSSAVVCMHCSSPGRDTVESAVLDRAVAKALNPEATRLQTELTASKAECERLRGELARATQRERHLLAGLQSIANRDCWNSYETAAYVLSTLGENK